MRGALPPPGQRIALAHDAAFSFVYPHLLKSWREAGAEILPFSPLADEAPPASADVVWLPGGYPELHAGRLASNANFIAGMRSFAATKPVHGECGGYMALGDGLIDAKGERHAMLGLLRLETSFAARKLHLGYRRAETPGLVRSRGARRHGFGPRVSLFLRARRGRRKAAKRDKRGSGTCARARPAPRQRHRLVFACHRPMEPRALNQTRTSS